MPGLPNADPTGVGADMSQWQNWLMSLLDQGTSPGMGYPAAGLIPRAAPGTPLGPISGANIGFGDVPKTFLTQRQAALPIAASMQPVPPQPPQQPGYVGSSGAGSGDPRAEDAAMNRMAGMAPGVTNPGYVPPGIRPGPAPAAIPGSPAARGINLGYYGPMTGNARQAAPMTYTNPNDPRIFRGPLAAPPAAQTIPPTATASVPPAARLNPSGTLALTGGNQPNPNNWASVPVPTPPPRPTGWPFNQ
jgi:hypothetical protein